MIRGSMPSARATVPQDVAEAVARSAGLPTPAVAGVGLGKGGAQSLHSPLLGGGGLPASAGGRIALQEVHPQRAYRQPGRPGEDKRQRRAQLVGMEDVGA
jgi:hypothetical protein